MEDPTDINFHAVYQRFLNASKEMGHYGVFASDHPTIPLPLHIHWSKLNVVSYILCQPLTDDTEQILEKLIKKKSPLNAEDRSVPALTAILTHARKPENHPQVLTIIKRLLECGADPCYLSRNTCVRPETVPDAIVMAAYMDCRPAVEILLRYWWPSPLCVLDSWLGNHTHQFVRWFPFLSRYGWLHGSLIAEVSEEYITSMLEVTARHEVWAELQVNMRQPCSLTQLCRLIVRKNVADQVKDTDKSFMEELAKLEVPSTLTSFLLMETP